jgi:hypothetical protein
MYIGICKNCGEEKEIHAHGICYHCYKKTYKQPTVTCKVCGKVKEHHSRGMCKNCVQKEFYYEQIKRFNIKKYHNIPLEIWRDVTKKCILCDFDKIVDLHHIDHNKENNSRDNLVGLCPNHHRIIHDSRFSNEVKNQIRQKLSQDM